MQHGSYYAIKNVIVDGKKMTEITGEVSVFTNSQCVVRVWEGNEDIDFKPVVTLDFYTDLPNVIKFDRLIPLYKYMSPSYHDKLKTVTYDELTKGKSPKPRHPENIKIKRQPF